MSRTREPLQVRIYRGALRLYPPAFREAWAEPMARDFATALEAASGLRRALALPAALADLAPNALERRRRARHAGVRGGGPAGWGPDAGRELAQAVRALRRRPAFTIPALLTLTLGMAATVAVFTVVDTVLIRPLPYPAGDRLVTVVHHAPRMDLEELPNAPATVLTYREAASFDGVAAYGTVSHNVRGTERAERVEVLEAEPGLFRLLGVEARVGRLFDAADARPEAAAVALLAYDRWRTHYGGDPGVLGTTVELGGVRREIVGVLPPGLAFPEAGLAFAVPYVLPGEEEGRGGAFGIQLLARLAPGISLAGAQREVADLQNRVVERFGPGMGAEWIEAAGWYATVVGYRDLLVSDVRAALWLVLGTVALVLVIACANVANLFLVRAEERRREIAVRAALGAGRGRLLAAFLAEGLLVAAGGAAAGCLLAVWAVRAFVARAGDRVPRLAEAAVDGRVLALAAALALLTGLLLGAIPVVRHLGRSYAGALRAGDRGATDSRERLLGRRLLVATQVALALILLTGSTLMLRSFVRLRAVDPGVRTEDVLVASVSLGEQPDRERLRLLAAELLEAVDGMAEVEAAAITNLVPLTEGGMQGGPLYEDGKPRPENSLERIAYFKVITPGFFATLGIPLLEGRAMTEADMASSAPPVWVNRALAESYFAGSPVGRRVRFNDPEGVVVHEIAGVVGDTRDFGLREAARPMAYFPLGAPSQAYGGFSTVNLAVRAARPSAAAPALRRVIERVRPDLPVIHVLTLEDAIRRDVAETTLTLVVIGLAAGAALLLGAIGVYGVIAYAVGRRSREIAIRMALGARARGVRRMVVRQGMQPVLLGVVVGLAGALVLTRSPLIGEVLFQTPARDPLTLTAVTLVLGAVAALATYLPARRASRVDPAEVLRSE